MKFIINIIFKSTKIINIVITNWINTNYHVSLLLILI